MGGSQKSDTNIKTRISRSLKRQLFLNALVALTRAFLGSILLDVVDPGSQH